jgi:hypothetical protein
MQSGTAAAQAGSRLVKCDNFNRYLTCSVVADNLSATITSRIAQAVGWGEMSSENIALPSQSSLPDATQLHSLLREDGFSSLASMHCK